MTEEQWIAKLALKKKLQINEAGLVQIVLHRILTPYRRLRDGNYQKMEYEKETATHWPGKFDTYLGRETKGIMGIGLVERTEEELVELLKREEYVWFKEMDIEDAIYEGKILLPEKPTMAPPAEPSTEERPYEKQDSLDYIQKRRSERVEGKIIAYELRQKFTLTYVEVARILELGKDLRDDEVGTLKQRGRRACEAGRKMLCERKRN